MNQIHLNSLFIFRKGKISAKQSVQNRDDFGLVTSKQSLCCQLRQFYTLNGSQSTLPFFAAYVAVANIFWQ